RDALVHAGVKPSNIFLTRDDRVILGDPSLPIPATGWDLPRLAYDFRYCPPELFRSPVELTPGADLYALGCVAHELFRGEPPFVPDNHYELISRHERDSVPVRHGGPAESAIHDFLATLLAKSPGNRFGSLDQAQEALARLEAALRKPAEPEAPRSLAPGMPTIAPAAAMPASSVHLLHEQSLMQFDGRQSIVPLTQGGGPPTGPRSSFAAGPPMPSQIGSYRIVREIGRGGMGVVYEAVNVPLDR